jgi:hypothetical protein
MATTTTRTVELQIKLNGVQSLEELEQVTAEINNELKGIATTSQEFKTMGSLAQKANSQLKEVNQTLEGITSTEKAESVNKLAQGMVGAFQAAAGASLIFGEKTSEELEKVIAKVGGLFAATDGLKKITEAFSAKNLQGLKASVKGFKESAIGAKLFGTATRTAIASTGIGLLVIAIGSIVANWDKVKVSMKKAFDFVKNFIPFFYVLDKIVTGIEEKFGSMMNLIKGIGAAIASIFTDQTMAEAFNEAVTAAMELDKVTKEYNDTILETQDLFDNEIELLGEMGNKQQEILDLQKKRYEEQVRLLKEMEKGRDLTEDEVTALKNAEQQLKLISVRQDNLNKKNAEKIAADKKKAADDKKTADDKAAADKKAAEDRAKEVKAAYERLKLSELELKTADEIYKKYNIIGQLEKGRLSDSEDILKRISSNVTDIVTAYDAWIASGGGILNSVKEIDGYLIDFQENTAMVYDESRKVKMGFSDIVDTIERFKFDESVKDDWKTYGTLFNDIVANNEELKNLETQRKQIQQDLNDGFITEREAQNLGTMNMMERLRYTESLRNTLQNINDLMSVEEKDAIKILDIQQSIFKVEEDNVKAKKTLIEEQLKGVLTEQERVDKQLELVDLNYELLSIGKNIKEVDDARNQLVISSTIRIAGAASAQLTSLQKYNKGLDKLKEKYGEVFNATMGLMNSVFELGAGFADIEADRLQDEYDTWLENQGAQMEAEIEMAQEVADAQVDIQEDANDRINDLNSELADAEGERYQDILDQIAEEEMRKQEAADAEAEAIANKAALEAKLAADKLSYEEDIAAQEKKAAKWRKAQSLVDASINTAVAIIAALRSGFPVGLIMAGIFAAMGAAQIALIAATPTYAEGGFTGEGGKYEPAGVVHKGEYVVPQHVMRKSNAIPMIQTLESMRLNGYAEGGMVDAAVPAATAQTEYLDYARIGKEVAQALKETPIYTSWVEWRDINNRAIMTENRASIRRR